MFHQLASHDDDLRRLLEKGYAVAFDSNHLVVRDIPCLDSEGGLQTGAIVAKLEFIDQVRVTQTDHQVYFAGSVPHGLDRKPIPGWCALHCPANQQPRVERQPTPSIYRKVPSCPH